MLSKAFCIVIPCEQRFLFCMGFSVYEFVRVVCQSLVTTRVTSDAYDFINAKSHAREKSLLAGLHRQD